jgi:hypothetical protein
MAGLYLLLIALPALIYYLWTCIKDFSGALVFPMIPRIPAPTFIAVFLYASWFLLQAFLQIAAPGKVQEGTLQSDGTSLRYKLNGWFSFWFTLVAAFLGVMMGYIPSTILYDQFGPMLTTANMFAFAFSLFVYYRGKRSERREHRTDKAVSDYFLGTALNPRLGSFDLKLFCESRPGLIL